MDFPIRLNCADEARLHAQLYDEYRSAILTGRLAPGQRVPSTRQLAKQLAVSRSTVTRTYEDLIAEGYLETSHGSGTFVCRELPDDSMARPLSNGAAAQADPPECRLSDYGERLISTFPFEDEPPKREINFYSWRPGFDAFPLELWARLLSRHGRAATRETLDYDADWLGCPPLREAVATYLARSRAVHCTPDQILITSGSQQAFHLITRVLLNPNDTAAVEDPGYWRIRQVFASEGARVLPVPIDDCGIDVTALTELPEKPRVIYVTPSHQYPTGAVLPLNRRLELVSWARENDVFVLEDDYDSEYRYAGRPFPSLQGLDQHGSVIYTGTFSKVLFPSIRLGYIVAPLALLPVLTSARRVSGRHCPTIDQLALAEFITEGHLERHLRRTRMIYNERRQALVEALRQYFGTAATITGENAGIHIFARLVTPFTDDEVMDRAARAGVQIASARLSYMCNAPGSEFLIGYASLMPDQIREGVRRLASALDVTGVAPELPSAGV